MSALGRRIKQKKVSHCPYANPINHKNLMLCLLGPVELAKLPFELAKLPKEA